MVTQETDSTGRGAVPGWVKDHGRQILKMTEELLREQDFVNIFL